jgi:hypothetical protein
MTRRIAFTIALACLCGCAYRLGSTLPADIRTVRVPVFVNQCSEPLIEVAATEAVIRELQKEGSLKVVSGAGADAVLDVRLVGYTLQPIRSEKDNVRTTAEYRMQITAEVVLKRARNDETVVKKKVVGESTFIPSGDMSASKRAALPGTAADLAHQVVESVTEAW